MRKIQATTTTSAIILLSTLLLSACTTTKQGAAPAASGFLPDYSLLKKGTANQAEKVYIKPDVAWNQYTHIFLDPVTIWRGQASRFEGVSPTDAQKMADFFYQTMHASLSQDFKMVSTPGPNTLRVSVALVKLKEANVAMETVSTVIPQARLLTSLSNAASDTPSFVGSASIEAKIVDAQTGVLFVAGADTRVGGRALSSVGLHSWTDVENVIKFWVDRSSYNLCQAQNRSNCVAPKN